MPGNLLGLVEQLRSALDLCIGRKIAEKLNSIVYIALEPSIIE